MNRAVIQVNRKQAEQHVATMEATGKSTMNSDLSDVTPSQGGLQRDDDDDDNSCSLLFADSSLAITALFSLGWCS